VLLGNGGGTFQTAQSYASAGYLTNSVSVGDFNSDGNPDLVLTSQCQDSTCKNGGVSVLLGNGNGTFQAAVSYNSGGFQADAVSVMDVNGDGKADLLVSNFCQNTTDCNNGAVSSLLGRGDGTFRGAHAYSSGGQDAYSLVAGDFNGDGNADVVVANSDGTCVLLGNGDGSFQTAIPYFPGGIFISTGDFNGDHQPDVVVANGSLSSVTALLNIVTGFRQATTTTLTSSPNPSAVNQSVLFTATVTTQFGGSPTGTVTFKAGTTTLGQGTVSNGQATLNYAFTSTGTISIVATYSGDSTFLPSSSAPLKQTVTKAVTTTTLTSSPNPVTVWANGEIHGNCHRPIRRNSNWHDHVQRWSNRAGASHTQRRRGAVQNVYADQGQAPYHRELWRGHEFPVQLRERDSSCAVNWQRILTRIIVQAA